MDGALMLRQVFQVLADGVCKLVLNIIKGGAATMLGFTQTNGWREGEVSVARVSSLRAIGRFDRAFVRGDGRRGSWVGIVDGCARFRAGAVVEIEHRGAVGGNCLQTTYTEPKLVVEVGISIIFEALVLLISHVRKGWSAIGRPAGTSGVSSASSWRELWELTSLAQEANAIVEKTDWRYFTIQLRHINIQEKDRK
jgi:hypothetical protein